ncbi:hypothetical protein CGMCC3_g3277 [Colletotrichum fructicola]|nr:uncharacterized protein CGMCC3_g3277 [Colletotrichum fructicola]KAE9580556.1 hypothetical protein CGMCC3_g3277 [Colletotrichum fructicola]
MRQNHRLERQPKLALELSGYDPFDAYGSLFVEAKSLDATAAAGCLSCVLLKESWGRLCHTEQLRSGRALGQNSQACTFCVSNLRITVIFSTPRKENHALGTQYPLYLGVTSYQRWIKCGCLSKMHSMTGRPTCWKNMKNYRSCLPAL